VRRWALALALGAAAASAQPRLAGRVTDAETGAPVVGAAVLVAADGDRQRGRATDGDGRFAFEALDAQRVAVRVTSLGYAPFDTTVALPAVLAVRLVPSVAATAEVLVQARRAETATRADAPVKLVPQAVAVVPAAVLDAQDARTLSDALRNVAGVTIKSEGEPGGVPVLRGFETDRTGGGVRRNGIEIPYLADGLRGNVERVEVLRGPASVLYGRLEPGGVVNVITERPEGRVREADAEGGTLGSARLAVDVGEAVGTRGAVRVNAEAERTDVGRDRMSGTTLLLAPAARWRPTDRLVLDADAEAVDASTVIDPGLASLGADLEALDAVPASRFFGEPTARHRWRSLGLFSGADWAASSRLGLRGTLSLARYQLRRDALDLDSLTSPTARPPTVARALQREGLGFTYLKGTTFADLRLRSGPVAHAVTLGAEAIRVWAQADGDAPLPTVDGALRFSLVDPISLDDPQPTGLDDTDDLTYLDASVHGVDLGAFVQDRASVPLGAATLHAVGAVRLSHVRYGATIVALADTPDAPAGVSEREAQVTAVTPSAGLVAEVGPVALYTSVGTSFNPIVERVDRNGEPFLPTRGLQVEGGLKAETSWASATVAAFWLRKDDALTRGPGGFYDQTGRQRSRGVEVEARAAGRGLVALATYAFLDAEVIEDDNVAPGTPLPYAPRHAASLWAEARRGPLAVRGGVWAQGERSGGLGSPLTLPASATADLGAEWAVRPGLALRLDVRNVTDARAYTAAVTRGGDGVVPLLVAWPAPAREVRLGVVVR